MTGTRMSKLLQWFKLPWLVASSSMLFAESPALDSIFQSSNLFHFFISKFQCLLSLYAASTYFSLLHWKSPDSFVKSQIKGEIRAIALVTILGVKQRREKMATILRNCQGKSLVLICRFAYKFQKFHWLSFIWSSRLHFVEKFGSCFISVNNVEIVTDFSNSQLYLI